MSNYNCRFCGQGFDYGPDIQKHETACQLRTRIKELEREREEAQASNMCAVCLGKPLASQKKCICGGTGLAVDAAREYRCLLFKAESDLAALKLKWTDANLTQHELNMMVHCTANGPFSGKRNYYCAGDDDAESWQRLVKMGLAEHRERQTYGLTAFGLWYAEGHRQGVSVGQWAGPIQQPQEV